MTTLNPNWAGSWTTTSINNTTITNGSNATTSSAIDLDNITSCEVSVSTTYGGTATEGLKIYVIRDIDGTNFETVPADGSWGFMLSFSTSTAHHRVFSVSGNHVNKFKIYITNDSGASVTGTYVRYLTSTTDIT